MVYVLSKSGKPLMPCENVIARLLLKSGKAKVKRREPFTIKLLYDTTEYTQPITLGIDTGSGTIGAAAVNEKGEVLYASEVEVRNDIKKKMDKRRKYRRTRRSRKTRYRKPRFKNRRNSKKEGRLSPTVKSKIDAHDREIKFVQSILPVTQIIMEIGHFDPAAMKDPSLLIPEIGRTGYQQGPNYGYENTRAYVLARDHHKCRLCKGASQDKYLEVHHIVYRSKGGSDHEDNLITLCRTCHKGVHDGTIKLKNPGAKKGTLKNATQVNVIASQMQKRHPGAKTTYGYVTAANRKALNLEKSSHWADAAVIATQGAMPIIRTDCMYRKKCIPEGDFQQRKGTHSEKEIPTGKIAGLRKFDKVRYRGKDCFVKGRQTQGYAILMDINGNIINFPLRKKKNPKTKPQPAKAQNAQKNTANPTEKQPSSAKNQPKYETPKIANMQRLQARTSWMVATEKIAGQLLHASSN